VSDFTTLPDLAALRLGGMVLVANDEFFAPKENLLKPEAPVFDPDRYTDRGKEMDGWETRRRREPGHDWCIVRLGIPGIVRGVVVDTSFFRGNYPDRCSVEGAVVEEDDVTGAEWFDLVPESALEGDAVNRFDVASPLRVSHLRLNIVPDGGVARLRVHGEPLPDLRTLTDAGGRADLAASLSGGVVLDASDLFFSSPHNLIAPGDSHGMHDGWETRRRRGEGHDWVVIRLATETEIERIEVDTSNFKGNYPDTCSLDARVSPDDAADPESEQAELTEVYVRRGLDRELAATVAERLMAVDPLGSHVRDELGLQPGVLARPLQAAVVSAVSFAVGAALPLTLIVLAPIGARILVTALAALLLLALLGVVGARLGGAPAGRAALRVTAGGALAMALAALIGQLVGATGL